jgi:hypothetical protein
MRAATRETMIRITAFVLVISIFSQAICAKNNRSARLVHDRREEKP